MSSIVGKKANDHIITVHLLGGFRMNHIDGIAHGG